MRGNCRASGFGVDIADMFHNVVLPQWLSELLPLAPVAFGDLSDDAHRALCAQLQLRSRPKQAHKFRPFQITLPMGFKWAVTLANSLVSEIIARCTRASEVALHSRISFERLLRQTRHLHLSSQIVLVLDILDEINYVAFHVEEADLLAEQRCLWVTLEASGLPVKNSKSTILGTLACDKLNFIGFDWLLPEHRLVPKDERATSVRSSATLSDASFVATPSGQYQRLDGKLIWTALSRRPLLATLRGAVLPNSLGHTAARLVAARGIRHFAQLSSLAYVRLDRLFSNICLSTDASPWRGGACFSKVTTREAMLHLSNAKHLKKMPWPTTDFISTFVSSRKCKACL